jgi:hypothetical protein
MQEAFCFSMAWRIWIMKHKIAALVADAFQDSEYFLPKITMQDQLGLDVEVVSSKKEPIEIYSYFSRIGMLDVNKSIDEADPNDIEYFTDGIRQWLSGRTQTAVLSKSGQA